MSENKPYKERYSLEARRAESEKIRNKFSDRIPIIVESSGKSTKKISKEKFLTPADLTVAQFVYVIRKRIELGPEESIWVFVKDQDGSDILPPTSSTMGTLYNDYVESQKDKEDWDGYLYMTYSGENVFG